MSAAEREFHVSPIVPESVMHNTKALSNLQSLTASVLGAAAGILGLESYAGFLFYAVFTLLTTALFYLVRVVGGASSSSSSSSSSASSSTRYFRTRYEVWTGGLFAGLPGYVLTWTLFYGLVRA